MSVHIAPVEGLCLAGGGGLAQQVHVPAGSARPVPFFVVPTAATAVSLKVVARGTTLVGDAVSKVLQIDVSGAALSRVPRLPCLSPSSALCWPGQGPSAQTSLSLALSSLCPNCPRGGTQSPQGVCVGGPGHVGFLTVLSPRGRRKGPSTRRSWSMSSTPWVSCTPQAQLQGCRAQGCGPQDRCQLLPSPQITEPGLWRFLATLTPT